jgi:hypothetical protein
MPTCRNSHTAVRSASRSQCEMAQISKIKIERQVRFLAKREPRRDRRLFYPQMDTCVSSECAHPIAEWQARRLLVAQSIVGRIRRTTSAKHSVSKVRVSTANRSRNGLLSNHSSAHIVPQFAQRPHNEASHRVSIDHVDRCDVGPGRSLHANFRNCRSGNGFSMQ